MSGTPKTLTKEVPNLGKSERRYVELERQFICLSGIIYHTFDGQFKDALDNKQILLFVILWSIFESECKGKSNLVNFANRTKRSINQVVITDEYRYFHDRYYDSKNKLYKKEKLMSLINPEEYLNNQSEWIRKINMMVEDNFSQPLDKETSLKDKYSIVLYLIYRLRCNIFHGSKRVPAWKEDESLIYHAITALLQIIYNVHLSGNKNGSSLAFLTKN